MSTLEPPLNIKKTFRRSVKLKFPGYTAKLAAASALSIVLFAQPIKIQEIHAQTVQSKDPFFWEIKPTDISPEMLRRWDYNLNRPSDRLTEIQAQKEVRIVYLVPSDKGVRSDYQTAAANAFINLQNFYQNEMRNGNRFSLHSPVVEVYQTTHTTAYYSANQNGSPSLRFWQNVLNDGFSLSGGRFNDTDNRWIYYIDADPACGQSIGGTSGVALMAANDLRGLSGEQNVPNCTGQSPDNGGLGRWIGGAGHELGHAFNLPHPPGCGGSGGCTGGEHAANSLMWVGYASYPNTYLLTEDKQSLFATGFFFNNAPVSVNGRVVRADGRGIFGARVSLADQNGIVKFAVTNPFGYYRFAGITIGQTYTISAGHKQHQFDSRQITPDANLSGIDFVSN